MSTHQHKRLNLKSRIYLFLLTPANLYFWFISRLFGIGWTGIDGDIKDQE